MINLLQQTINLQQTSQEFNENNKKTEMEWNCLLNYLQSPSQSGMIKSDSPITLHTDKKFEKDLSGQWVWYKNQVLPTLKIKLIPSSYRQIIVDEADITNLDYFVAIQCFAVFSNNQILEVKLEGTTLVKFNKEKVADMRSIRLTETINSLNCRYFLFTLTTFQGREGNEQKSFELLEQKIQRSSHGDDIRLRALKNTLISQCISIQTRKKSLHQRVSLLCQLHPFVPNEFNRLLQMLHGENPEEILSSDIRGLYFYFSNKKIRHKIFHPFYLAARFNKAIRLYYLDNGNDKDADLSDVFLKVQKEVEQALLSEQNDEECYTNQKKKNQRTLDAKLIVQILGKKSASNDQASCQKTTKPQNFELFKSKVLNYLMPLQSNAIKIIDEDDVITPQYKSINYDETLYGLAYTKIFPKILNTLFEYQEKRAQYPSYLHSVGYSAQKEEATDFSKEANKEKNKQIIKYKSTLIHKYDEKLRSKLTKIQLNSDNQQVNILKSRSNILIQEQSQQFTSFGNNNMVIQQQEASQQSGLTNAMMMKFCGNMEETNRKSYTSTASETVPIKNQNSNNVNCKQQQNNVGMNNNQKLNDDAQSHISDQTERNEDNIDYFTPGDNKIKIRKMNVNNSTNKDNCLNHQQNSVNLFGLPDNKNISEFKTIDPIFFPQQNNQSKPLNHLQDLSYANLLAQPTAETQNQTDLANYQLIFQQIANQNSAPNNVSSLINISNSNQSQQNLIQNLQQFTQQSMNQQQFLHQQQQQHQNQAVLGAQLNQTSNNNNLQSLLLFNKLNQVQNPSLNQLIYDNNILQQNQLISTKNSANLTFNNNSTNLQNLQQLLINQNNFSTIIPQQNILQNQQSQDLLNLIQLNQQKQQQQLQIQQMIQQQQQQQIQPMNEQFNQQNQYFMNPLINQSNQPIFTEVSRKSIPLQPQQQNIIQMPLQQQHQLQANQFSIRNNNNNQFDNQMLADMCQQVMMPQFQ
ncbi:zinc finger transcription factor sma protein, putative (macronuclear) [Tetrahymena thermophila SB210]|uniref:Zinc finger transcription factor sma protein, putative n=1 Tax=Tetrahymena thermophila (strain SB210) TaxID=312017 RepID=I7M8A8_TETTS|nr:zinc finger transcription factor sma protein, putative [Tetrahymena thermophila SB210]EAR97521.2 zinc finger transcription factor sma protein, putative [Tetrahymena thermophila SB210]|eukprot:XP_001017766.2 zinc finger transcription factor sma protein, putative [Tetrahymena thermophila SB210]